MCAQKRLSLSHPSGIFDPETFGSRKYGVRGPFIGYRRRFDIGRE